MTILGISGLVVIPPSSSSGPSTNPPPIWPGTSGIFAETPIPAASSITYDIDVTTAPNNTGISIQFSHYVFVVNASPGGAWLGEGLITAYRSNIGTLIGAGGQNLAFRSAGEGVQGAFPGAITTPDNNTLRISIDNPGAWEARFKGIYTLAFVSCAAPIIT